MTTHNLEALLSPRSVAVIGASTKPDSVGHVILANVLAGGFPGPVYAVNPKRLDVPGAAWAESVDRLPGVPDVAIIATPASTVPGIIGSLGRAGTRVAVVISAGITEASGLRNQMLNAARAHGLRIVGPNCLGLLLPHARLNASFSREMADKGHLALISQSGAVVAAMLDTAADRKIGFSGVASVGDMADVDLGDLIDHFARDPQTRAILLYIEGVNHTAKFMSAARAASRLKPIVAVKAGQSPNAADATRTHTGALAGSHDVYSAAFRRAGIVEVKTVAELFDAAEILCHVRTASGNRVAIVTNGGGAGILAVDALAENGLQLAQLSDHSRAALDETLAHWSHGDPIDLGGDAGTAEYLDAIQILRRDEAVDAIIVMNCPTALAEPGKIAEAVAGRFAHHPGPGRYRPLIGCWLGHGNVDAARAAFSGSEFPLFDAPEKAVRALSYLLAAHHARELIPAAGEGIGEAHDRPRAEAIIAKARDAGRTILDEIEAKSLLAAYGVPVVETRFAADAEGVRNSSQGLHPPFAVKIVSPTTTHKSDVGGVALNLRDGRSAAAAAKAMAKRIARDHPEVEIAGFTVQSMVARAHSHELIVGISDDATFGPILAVGAGGKAVELLHDRSLDLPPIDTAAATRMIAGTRIGAQLAGYRGEPAANCQAVADVITALSALAVDIPDVIELDINPLLVDPSGAIALDARIRISPTPRLSRLAIKPTPMEWSADLTTRDGSLIHVRPARAQDGEALAAFFRLVSDEDRHFRFLSARQEVTAEQIGDMICADPRRTITFLAFDHDQALVAATTLVSDSNSERAEVAVSVRADCKGRGIGWRMLEYALRYASAHSIRIVESLESAENHAALEIEREMGFSIARASDDPADLVASKSLATGRRHERA